MKFPEQHELENNVIQKLLSGPDRRSLQGRRDYAVIRLLLETGVRISELAGLYGRHLIQNETQFSIQVKTLKQRKIKNQADHKEKEFIREIPLKPELVEALSNYWQLEYGSTFPPEDAPFFKIQPTGIAQAGPITLKAIRGIIQKYKIEVGIQARITAHTFRHTFLSRIARLRDVETARQLAGHVSINSTQHYLHSTPKRKRDAIGELDYGI